MDSTMKARAMRSSRVARMTTGNQLDENTASALSIGRTTIRGSQER
jgi:hypothetical protein